jgi:aldose 1-epimerase
VQRLLSGDAQVTIDTAFGGRIAQITIVGQPVLVDPVLVETDATGSIRWGSFPMAPWAGRLRNGRLGYEGVEYQLPTDHVDADGTRHAIHGTVLAEPWMIDALGPDWIEMHCDLQASGAWPFAGVARQRISLTTAALRCDLSVEATNRSFPCSIGWHPWFLKPDRVTFIPQAMYRRAAIGLPTEELVEPVPGPWDDTFINTGPVTLHYDSRRYARSLTVTSDCDHWVVFDQPAHATCVEPQSGPPDAPNVKPQLITPGHPLTRWMQVTWK